MKKIIKIDGKEYAMQSSAYTQLAYKDLTGRSLLADINEIAKVADKIENDISLVDDITKPILDISFVMIQEADKEQYRTKEDFYKSIESLFDDFSWVNEVLALAINPLSRQLQSQMLNNK